MPRVSLNAAMIRKQQKIAIQQVESVHFVQQLTNAFMELSPKASNAIIQQAPKQQSHLQHKERDCFRKVPPTKNNQQARKRHSSSSSNRTGHH